MTGGASSCAFCGNRMAAKIADLQVYDQHDVPVWRCGACDVTLPVLRIDRHDWVDCFQWDLPGLVYGGVGPDPLFCLACGTETMQAGLDFTLIEAFPFWEARQPSWLCSGCGFCDRAVYRDRYVWADHYQEWK